MALTNVLIIVALIAMVAQAGLAFNDFHQQHRRSMQHRFRPIRMPYFPARPADIAAIKPGPGQYFSGVSVSSSSKVSYDKDGNVIHTGGSTIMTNNNGKVDTITAGKSPPPLDRVINAPSMDELEFPEFPEIPKFKFPEMPEINFPKMPKMKPFDFKPIIINPEDIRDHVPEDNENFVGLHTASFSHSSNFNGVQSSVGGSNVVLNNNGKVDEDTVRFQQGDKPTKDKKKKVHIEHMKAKPYKFKPMKFKPIIIESPKILDFEDLKNHVPKKNEKFVGFTQSSFRSSLNNNGVKSSVGASHTVLNDNGKVDEEKVKFAAGDKTKAAQSPKEDITIENED